MSRLTQRYILALALMTGCLQGCAVHAVYEKCGFRGCPGDVNITAEVQGLLAQHPALGPPNVLRVQTLDRVVYLYGLVSSELQRDLAESVARQAAGGVRVVNSIALTYSGR